MTNNRVSGFAKAIAKAEKASSILGDNFEKSTNELVLIDSIKEPKYHDRKEYNQEQIKELAESMKYGQWQPIVLRKLPNGDLERIVGFRRIKAAKYNGWTYIEAKIYNDIDDSTAILIMLTENLQRVDPNIYDQTQAMVDYIKECLEIDFLTLKSLLEAYKNAQRGRKVLSVDEQEKISFIEKSLSKIGSIAVATFRDRVAMFGYPEHIKGELKKGFLLTYAREIVKIKNEAMQKEAIAEVKNITQYGEYLSKNEVKELCLKYIKPITIKTNRKISLFQDISFKTKELKKHLTGEQIKTLDVKKQEELNALISKVLDIVNSSTNK